VGALGARALLASALRVAVAAVAALAVWWVLMPSATAVLWPWRFAWAAGLAVGAAAAAVTYLGLCLVLRVEEARRLAAALLRRAG
jgi:hypothetical protein